MIKKRNAQQEKRELTALRDRVRQLTDECAVLRQENRVMREQLDTIRVAAFGGRLQVQTG